MVLNLIFRLQDPYPEAKKRNERYKHLRLTEFSGFQVN